MGPVIVQRQSAIHLRQDRDAGDAVAQGYPLFPCGMGGGEGKGQGEIRDYDITADEVFCCDG